MNYCLPINMQYFLMCTISLLLLTTHQAHADIEQLQALSFGKLVVLTNAEPELFRIDKEGDVSYSDAYRVIEPPERASFRIFNLPANTPITVSTLILQPALFSPSPNLERFTFAELDHFGLVTTDELGEVTIWVGGAISTSGEGSINFGDFPLAANYRFTIDF